MDIHQEGIDAMRAWRIIGAALLLGSMPASLQALDRTESCPTIPLDGGDVVVLSRQGGTGAGLPLRLGATGPKARVVTVIGKDDAKGKIALVLVGGEPTVWDLRRISDRVTSVVAYGRHPQAVAGLPAETPASFHSWIGMDQTDAPRKCGSPESPRADVSSVSMLAGKVLAQTGRHPRRWVGGTDPSSFNVDGYWGDAAPPQAFDPRMVAVRAGVPVVIEDEKPRLGFLEEMVAQGFLKRFEPSDVARWRTEGATFAPIGSTILRTPMGYDNKGPDGPGYLVLRSILAWPAGLRDGSSVSIVVPPGVVVPAEAGMNRLYAITGRPGQEFVALGLGGTTIPFEEQGRESFNPARATVEWDETGRLIHSSGMESTPDRFPVLPGNARTTKPKDSDMPLAWMFALALFAVGAKGVHEIRRRLEERGREDAAPEQTRDTPASGHEPDAWLKATLQKCIELSREDETTLALVRIGRSVVEARAETGMDHDLRRELEAVIDRHLPQLLSNYVRIRSRATARKVADMEQLLRDSLATLTLRIADLLTEQETRDRDSMTIQNGFVHARHDDSAPGGL